MGKRFAVSVVEEGDGKNYLELINAETPKSAVFRHSKMKSWSEEDRDSMPDEDDQLCEEIFSACGSSVAVVEIL